MYYKIWELNVSLCVSQEKKVAAKQKISQMEAELEVASKEMKAAKEEEDAQRLKSIRWAYNT